MITEFDIWALRVAVVWMVGLKTYQIFKDYTNKKNKKKKAK